MTWKQWVVVIILGLIVLNNPQLVMHLIDQALNALNVFSQNLGTMGTGG